MKLAFMKHRLFNTALLIPSFLAVLLLSINALATTANDQKINSAQLEEIKTLFSNSEEVSGSFFQTKRLHNFQFPLESSGNFSIDTDGNLTWDLLEPIQSSITISETEIIFSEPESASTPQKKERPEVGQIVQIIRAVFSLDWRSLEQQFSIRVDESAPNWKVTLKPKGGIISTSVVYIELSGSNTLNRVVIEDVRTDRTTITFDTNQLTP